MWKRFQQPTRPSRSDTLVLQDLKTAYYQLAFRLRYVESTGDTFQDFFSSLMEMRYPADFTRVRPWGKIGDRKNDGYLRSKRMLFQCFAPREMKVSTCLAKIKTDFRGALPYWRKYFDQWLFTHNDRAGLAPDVLKALLDLSMNYKPVVATHWGYVELLNEFKTLSEINVASLLGPAPELKDVVALGLEDVRPLLDHIALQPEPMSVDLRPVPPEKLQYNQLSSAAATLLRAGMTRTDIVKRYLRGLSDQTRYDRVAATFRLRYLELKESGLMPDDIFVALQKFIAGDTVATPSHQASALAVLAFFFEACEIFEQPPSAVSVPS